MNVSSESLAVAQGQLDGQIESDLNELCRVLSVQYPFNSLTFSNVESLTRRLKLLHETKGVLELVTKSNGAD